MQLAKKLPRSDLSKELLAKVEKTRDSAKKDNELIYHELVPDPKTLPSLGVAVVAKRSPITFPLAGEPPQNLFKVLVPIPVHSALEVAEAVRRQLVGVEVGRLRDATGIVNGVMASMGLPASLQVFKGADDDDDLVLPNALAEKVASVQSRGGVQALREKVSSLANGSARNNEIVDDVSYFCALLFFCNFKRKRKKSNCFRGCQ